MASSYSHRPSNILLAVDGSAHSRAATTLLRDLPLPDGCTITALAVLIPRNASDHASLLAVLEQTRNLLERKDIEVVTELVAGYPAEEIRAFAEEIHPDLIVVGAKGLRATLGILVGGVAQHVLEYADSPVLVVRSPYNRLQRMLVAVDGSPCSQTALEYLASFALPAGVEVQVAHVLPPLPDPDLISKSWAIGMEMMPPIPLPEIKEINAEQAEAEQRQGNEILEQAIASLAFTAQIGLPDDAWQRRANPVLLRGDAATEIIKLVKEQAIDLVVAGSRGLSQLRGMLLGSVSRKLVHYAGCNVMIVR